MATFFSDYFDIDPDALDEYGAFNVSIINDLPLFIDPFLLFNSEKQDYRNLHDQHHSVTSFSCGTKQQMGRSETTCCGSGIAFQRFGKTGSAFP